VLDATGQPIGSGILPVWAVALEDAGRSILATLAGGTPVSVLPYQEPPTPDALDGLAAFYLDANGPTWLAPHPALAEFLSAFASPDTTAAAVAAGLHFFFCLYELPTRCPSRSRGCPCSRNSAPR
jgi:hypothetical protein